MEYHGNSPEWVIRESLRLFPLDLSARVEWIRDMANHSISEADRHEIFRRLNLIRNGS